MKPKTKLEYIEYFKKHGITKLPPGESLVTMWEKLEQYRRLSKEIAIAEELK